MHEKELDARVEAERQCHGSHMEPQSRANRKQKKESGIGEREPVLARRL
jgi:hypothetical protein